MWYRLRPLHRVLATGALISATVPMMTRAQEAPKPSTRSEQTALLLSAGGVAVPVLASLAGVDYVFVAGMLVGPAIGHAYAGNTRRAVVGTLGRTALAAVGAAVSLATFEDDQDGTVTSVVEGALHGGFVLAAFGVAVAIWDAIDIIAAPGSARRHNAQQGNVAPVYPAPPMDRSAERARANGCVTICSMARVR